MPEMRFRIRWPDGRLETCYSPSLVVKDYLVEGESYTLADFLDRSRAALSIAAGETFGTTPYIPSPRRDAESALTSR